MISPRQFTIIFIIVISIIILWFSSGFSTKPDDADDDDSTNNNNAKKDFSLNNINNEKANTSSYSSSSSSSNPVSVDSKLYEAERIRDYLKIRELVQNPPKSKKSIVDDDIELLSLVNPIRASPLLPGPGACPLYRHKFGRDADSKTSADAIKKYSRYTSQYCNSSGMLQMHFGLRRFIGFMDIMAKIIGLEDYHNNNSVSSLKENEKKQRLITEQVDDSPTSSSSSKSLVQQHPPPWNIFDLGSGCGTLLNYFHLKFNTVGTGIDLTPDAVKHSRDHARGSSQTYCHLDATLLRFFPSNHYDAIVSWAVLYHIRRTWVQCGIVQELARMLKPGGIALIAQLRTEKTQAFWKKGKCQVANCTWRRLSDAATFHEKSFKRNGFFSIYLRKFNEGESGIASTLPINDKNDSTKDED